MTIAAYIESPLKTKIKISPDRRLDLFDFHNYAPNCPEPLELSDEMDGRCEPTPLRTFYHEAMLDRFHGIMIDPDWAEERHVDESVLEVLLTARQGPPADFKHQQGWVLLAFQNAVYQLLHAPSLEEGLVDTVMRGGDTDTNAAIAVALLGAVYGRSAIPAQWADAVLSCRPDEGLPRVHKPRPECFWPVDVLELAERLLRGVAQG